MFDLSRYPNVRESVLSDEDSDLRLNPPQLTRPFGAFRHPILILLLLLGLILLRGIHRGEAFYDTDETRHAMDGVFVRDLLIDHPLKHPIQYTYDYYSKYPAIALPHWPPLFAIVEGLFFIVLGVSVWVSRLAILCFALLGIYFWYRIAERFGPRSRALLSATIFSLLPPVLIFESVTMLEIPQLSLCLGAVYFWLRWLDRARTREFWSMAGLATAAMLTYQMSIFLVFFLGLDFIFEHRFRLLRNWQVWVATASSLLTVVAWYAFSFQTLTFSYQRVVGQPFHSALQRWSIFFYPSTVPHELGLLLSVLGLIGICWAIFRAPRQYRFFLLWVSSAYLCYTLIAEKDARHILIWFPPLIYFALVGIEALWPWGKWMWIPYLALAMYFSVGALRFKRPDLEGVESVARFVMAQPESDIVYYQGALNGDFIFCVRQLDPLKTHVVARDKQIEVTNVVYAQRPVLQTAHQVLDFFRTWGIRYAVIETGGTPPDLEMARSVIQSDNFEFVRRFAVHLQSQSRQVATIEVYRFRGGLERSREPVEIPMMTIHHSLHADLNRLAGRPWPN